MKKLIVFFIFLSFAALADKSYQSFFVRVGDQKISVTAPGKRQKVVTIVVKNESFDKIVSELKTESKTLKRFVLDPSGEKGDTFTVTVKISDVKTLYYVSIAPPFQEVPLTFSRGTYEIP